MRPQLIGVLLFSVTLWILAGRRTHPRALWVIPALVLVWVNVHGSFVLRAAAAGTRVARGPEGRPGHGSHDPRRVRGEPHRHAREPVRPRRLGVRRGHRHQSHDQPPGDRVGAAHDPRLQRDRVLRVRAARRRLPRSDARRPLSWPQLLWLAAFFVLALPALRGVVWWGLVFPVVVAGLLKQKADAVEERGSPFMNALLVTTIVAAAVIVMPIWRAPDRRPVRRRTSDRRRRRSSTPQRRRCRPGRACSCRRPTRRGSSSSCRPCPSSSTRGSSSSRRRSGTSYLEVGGAREGWQTTLDRWDVDAVVINPDQDGVLTSHIRDDPAWRLAFKDDERLPVRAGVGPATRTRRR